MLSKISSCLCFRPPARGVCPKYEVVEFQPRTVTPPDPMLCGFLLRTFLLDPPRSLLSLPDVLQGGSSPSCTDNPSAYLYLHRIIRLPGCHLYSPQHTNASCLTPPIHPASPVFYDVRAYPLQPSLPPATSAGFLLPSHPCRFRNCFYRDPQLIFCCLLPSPWHPESPPSLVTCLSCTNTKNRPVGHPLHHCRLSPVHIFPERMCPHSL